MSNLIFPSTLKGFDIKVSRSPVYGTLVQTAASGKELRASFEAWPRYRYSLQLNFVREAGFSAKTLQDETANLNRFFQIHLGSWDSFLFQDPLDYTVTGMGFGLGDGTTTAFQLQRVLPGQITDSLGSWPAYSTPRTNLCPQSQTLDTGWSSTIGGTGVAPVVSGNYALAPDNTPTADRVQFNQGAGVTSSDFSFLTTPTVASVTPGQTYTLSIWLKSNTGASQTIVLGFGSLMSASQVVTVTASWQRFTMTFNAVATSGTTNLGLRGTATTGSTADLSVWGAQVEAGSTATRYIPTTSAAVTAYPTYYPNSGDGFEPVYYLNGPPTVYRTDWQGTQQLYQTARTNLLKYSQDLTQAAVWPANVATATGGQASPDGGTGGTLLTATGGGGDFIQNVASPATDAYTLTIYAKPSGTSVQRLLIRDGTAGVNLASANFDMAAGAVTLLVGTTLASMTAVGGGWYRIRVSTNTLTIPSGNTIQAYVYAGQGTTSDSTVVFGAQLERGNTSTSYIATTTAAVSRTDYTVSSTGMVTLAVAPVSGAYLTWTGTYYRRVRFDGDSIELERMVSGAWDGKTVKLITVK